jgi:hypothetical protein
MYPSESNQHLVDICTSNSLLLILTFPNPPSLVLNLSAKQFFVTSSKARTHNPSLTPYKSTDPNILPTKQRWLNG